MVIWHVMSESGTVSFNNREEALEFAKGNIETILLPSILTRRHAMKIKEWLHKQDHRHDR